MNEKGSGPAGARLRSEYDRLRSADPFQVLGVATSAEGPAIRWAFLELTKRYHPNRFARESAEVQHLANELFLVIRRAYQVLQDEGKRKSWRERIGSGKSGPQTVTTPIVVPPPTTPPTAPLASPVAPPQKRPSTPPPVQKRPSTPPSGIPALPAAESEKRRLFEEASRLAEQGKWAEARQIFDRLSRGTAPPSSPPAAPFASPAAAPTTSPGPPSAPSLRPPSEPSPAPRGSSTSSPVSFKPRPSTPPSGTPGQGVSAILEAARMRTQRFEEAQRVMAQGHFKEAREAFHKIAAEDPQTKKFRVYLYYAWGLEHRAAGRIDEAIKELERAVQLDPELTEIKRDLEKTREMKKGGGLFGKWFR